MQNDNEKKGAARLVARVHPFAPDDRIYADIEAGRTVESIVSEYTAGVGVPHVAINGEIVPASDYARAVAAGDAVALLVSAAGGDDASMAAANQKMNWGTAAAAAGIVLLGVASFFTGGLAGALVIGGGILFGAGAALAGVGILTATGVFEGLRATGAASNSAEEAALSIRGGGNQAPRIGTKIPVVLGRHLVTPYYAGRPFTGISGSYGKDQAVTMLYCIGAGPLKLSNLKFGENLIATNSAGTRNGLITADGLYTGLTIRVGQDGGILSPYSCTIVELALGIELTRDPVTLPETWQTTAPKTNRADVEVTFPSGLYAYDNNGHRKSQNVQIEIVYRVAGSGTPWASCMAVTPINETVERAAVCRFVRTIYFPSEGTYEVGVRRLFPTMATDERAQYMVVWSILRSWRTAEAPVDAAERAGNVFVVITARASAQLSGVLGQFNCIAEAEAPVYSGSGTGPSAWATSAVTRNPAALALMVLRSGDGSTIRKINPRPVTNDEIDWPRFEAWYQLCATKGWTCDAVVGGGLKLRDLLMRIGSTGRASFTIRSGKYSVVVDEPKSDIVQLFTPRNVKDFSWSKEFADLPRGLRVSFISASDGYEVNERIVPAPGYTAAEAEEKLQSLELWGITDPARIYKEAMYRMAVAILRPEVWSFTTDAEGIVCEQGDLVLVSHDSVVVGRSWGRVVEVYLNGSDSATGARLDERVTMVAGESYGMWIRRADGAAVYAELTFAAGESNVVTFAAPITSASRPAPGDLFTFGVAGVETLRGIVYGIDGGSDMERTLYVVPEAPGVHTADSGIVPAFDSRVSLPPAAIIAAQLEAAVAPVVEIDPPEAVASKDEAAALDAAIARAEVTLSVSAPAILRSRARELTPPTLLFQSKNRDLSPYPGRMIVSITFDDGTSWVAVYGSASDESSYEYTVPAVVEVEGVERYVSGVRGSLYAAGGTDTLLREVTVPVALDSSASAIYWGALTTAPTSGYVPGDYYFDTSLPAAGGGEVYYYDGDSWVVSAPSWPGYESAWAQARVDAYNWMTEKATEVEEAVKLATATASAMAQKQIVATLPVYPYTGYAVGDIVVLTTNKKLYRLASTSTAGIGGWTTELDGADVADNTIYAEKIVAGARDNPNDPRACYPAEDLSEYPDDPAGTTYIQDAWATTDGWNGGEGGSTSVTSGNLVFTHTGANQYLHKSISFSSGTWRLKIRLSSGSLNSSLVWVQSNFTGSISKPIATDGSWTIVDTYFSSAVTSLQLFAGSGLAYSGAYTLNIDFIYIGTGAYLPGSLVDTSGNGNHATIYGGVPDGDGGIIRDGKNDYERTALSIAMPDIFHYHESLEIPNHATQIQVIFTAGISTAGYLALYRDINNQRLRLAYYDGVVKTISFANFFEIDDTKVELDLGIDWLLGTYIIYKNGTTFASVSIPGAIKPSSSVWYFGNTYTLASNQFCGGRVSNRRWYNRALSVAEIKFIIENKATPRGMIITDQLVAGCVTAAKIAVADLAASAAFISALEASTAYIEMLGTNTALANYLGANTALINTLTAQTAFIEALFAQQITVPDGGRIRYETGAGVQKRCVQLADEKIDWLDTPDTTPASPEVLRARIGRLGVGGAVLLDGEFQANITPFFPTPSTIDATSSEYPDIIELPDGTKRVAYMINSNGYLYERVYSAGAWGSASLIVSAITFPCKYLYTSDGKLYLFYSDDNANIYFMLYNGSSWDTPMLITASFAPSGSKTFGIIEYGGYIRLAYRDSSTGYIKEKVYNGASWSAPSSVVNINCEDMTYTDGGSTLRLIYRHTNHSQLYNVTLSVSWSLESAIPGANALGRPSSLKLINGDVWILYKYDSAVYKIELIDSSWGSPSIIVNYNAGSPSAVQLLDGSIDIILVEATTLYLKETILQRYARIGAGIIESGDNYVLYGDGTLDQWHEETSETTTNLANGAIYYMSVDMTLPIAYSSISLVIPIVRASSEITWAGRGYAKDMTVINVTVLGATASARGRAGYFVRGKI